MFRRFLVWCRSSSLAALAAISPNQRIVVVLDQDVEKDIGEEITRLSDALLSTFGSSIPDLKAQTQYTIGLLIIIQALESIRDNGRYNLFRPASSDECADAGINADLKDKKDKNDHSLVYHFFETYGYRFTILINLQTLEGFGLHMERVTASMGSVADSLGAAEQLRKPLS